MSKNYQEHSGTCAFCHSSVNPQATVCPSCNARWQQVNNLYGNLLGLLAFPAVVAGIIGFGNLFLGSNYPTFANWSLAFFVLWLAAILSAGKSQPWRWVR